MDEVKTVTKLNLQSKCIGYYFTSYFAKPKQESALVKESLQGWGHREGTTNLCLVNLVSISALCWKWTWWHCYSISKVKKELLPEKYFLMHTHGWHHLFSALWLLNSFTCKTTVLGHDTGTEIVCEILSLKHSWKHSEHFKMVGKE